MPIYVYEVTRKSVVAIEADTEWEARREATEDPNGEQMAALMKGEPFSVELIDWED